MRYEESREIAISFFPVIRRIFQDAPPTVESREHIMRRLNFQVHSDPRYQRLPNWAKTFLAGYVECCFEQRFGPGDARE